MACWSMLHLTNGSLHRELSEFATQDRTTTAGLLARISEFEERRLFAPAGYPSMVAYCVGELCMSEDMALMRVRVAHSARRFPALLDAVADGRLSLTAALLLVPHLTVETADELLVDAAGKTKDQIRILLAGRFPRPDVPTLVQAVGPPGTGGVVAAQPEAAQAPSLGLDPLGPSLGANLASPMEPLAPRPRVAPLSPGRFAVQFTIDQATHDKLRHAQALLGHTLPSGDVAKVFDRALDALVKQLEKQKFGKCARPRPQKGVANGRHIPAAVKRAVYERDGVQCTFVSDKGKRCESRMRLELDHIEPVARGGESTTDNLRVRCRAHNHFEAECTFSAEFMAGKREEAQDRAARAKPSAEAKAQAIAEAKVRAEAKAKANVEAKAQAAAAERCAGMVGAPLERRVFVACQGLGPRGMRRALPMPRGPA